MHPSSIFTKGEELVQGSTSPAKASMFFVNPKYYYKLDTFPALWQIYFQGDQKSRCTEAYPPQHMQYHRNSAVLLQQGYDWMVSQKVIGFCLITVCVSIELAKLLKYMPSEHSSFQASLQMFSEEKPFPL